MCKFFARGEFKWIEPIEFDLEVDLEYVKQIRELHKYYLLDPDKTKIKKQILSNYQLKLLIFIILILVMFKNCVYTSCIRIQSITVAKIIC